MTLDLSRHGYLHVRWRSGAVVTEVEAIALKSRAAELSAGQALPMLVEMASMTWIDRRATEIFAAPWPLVRMALVGVSPVDEVIAAFYAARHTHSCQTRFFTSMDEAVTWLTGESPRSMAPTTSGF
nr:STAS/SEC14 domain-containing protein [Arthrobacter ulcerisalmonis]